ncbi:hypothetical protein P4O66_011711 [Electrophorus voltai]|uniref:Sterile alpha motif domain-containing protein 5 n=1 Tax=Electrophorus voltai TaxID=2609070 RepID=A0AAD8Z859_9TELE|nr:hypothetical protein P4O66_011711 [Electrophorus voltai]
MHEKFCGVKANMHGLRFLGQPVYNTKDEDEERASEPSEHINGLLRRVGIMSSGPTIVYEWLKRLQLCQYVEAFVDNGYDDLEVCKQIGDPDLDAIGVFSPRHRQKILRAVERLREEDRKVAPGLYFTLEPLPGVSNIHSSQVSDSKHNGSKKLVGTAWNISGLSPGFGLSNNPFLDCPTDPVTYPKLKLKILIRDKLVKDGVDLSKPPYSFKDGSLGNLEDLAKEYSEYYSTSFSNVCDRMEELRKRKVAQEAETVRTISPCQYVAANLAVIEIEEKAEATTTSLQLCSEIQTECQAYLNWPSFQRSHWVYAVLCPLLRWREGEDVGFVASEITMSDEERIQLMMMVKEKMITVEEALARLKEYETQSKQSCVVDTTEWLESSGSAVDELSNCNQLLPSGLQSQEQTDDEMEESVAYRRLHKLVSSTRRVRKKLIRIDEAKKPTSKDLVSSDVSPTCEENMCLYSGMQKQVAISQGNGLASVPQAPLSTDGDMDVLITSPSSSGLDTYSNQKLFKGFSKPSGSSQGSGQMLSGPSGATLGSSSGFSTAEVEGCGKDHPRMARSVTDGEMRRTLSSSNYHGRACSFGGFDLMNRAIYMGNKNCEPSGEGGAGRVRGADQSPALSRISLGKKVKSVKETMRKRISKKTTAALPEQSSPSRMPGSPQSPCMDPDSLEKPKLKAGGSVESLRSSLSGQSSMSGQTVSTTDSSASNRESVKSEEGEDDELPYKGPFCGRALRGDVIDIISKPPMGTWMGLLNNKVGTFKFIYVDVLSEEEKPKRSIRKRRKGRPPKPTSVEELLERINLKEHMPTFLFNGYEDLDTFKLLEEEDLDELNITDPQHRAVLLTAVELLQEYDSNSDPERGGYSGDLEEKVLSESQVLPGDSPRDSGCFESNENLENGRCKKTSHLSRSSSGFESSHLPSPEYPTPPLSQPSRTSIQSRSHPQDLLHPFKMTTIKGLCFGASHCLTRAKPLSQSFDRLVCLPAPRGLWKHCLSLDDLLPYQVRHRKETYRPEDPRCSPVETQGLAKTEASFLEKARTCGNLKDDSKEPFTGDQLPVTYLIAGVEGEEVLEGEDVAEAYPEDPPQCTQCIKPPVPPKPLPLPFVKDKEVGPDNRDVSPGTSLPQLSDATPNIPRFSKPFIHRLGKKVPYGKTVSLESVVEEKLSSDGIDLTEEPYSDKLGRYGVPFSLIQRYSEDLDKPLGDIATVMDHTRIQQLRKQHRMAVINVQPTTRKPSTSSMRGAKALPFPSQVMYNRVGKCGSRTVVLLLRILAEKHQFTLISSDIHNKTRLSKREQLNLMKNISTVPQPFLYTRHVHFLSFTRYPYATASIGKVSQLKMAQFKNPICLSRFQVDEPVYINIIRDPIDRFLSNYFFRRFGDWRGEENHLVRTPGMKDNERYLDINTCILESYAECSNPRLFYIIPYFCGQHPQCREPSLWALQKAKENVLEHYLLVGVLEELQDVLLLLERLLPHFFTDVLNIYKSPEYRKLWNLTVTVHKQSPSLEALQVLYQRMEHEYDFYNFIKAQFHLTKRKFGLRSGPHPSQHRSSLREDHCQ